MCEIMGIMGSIPRMQFRDQIGNRLSQRWVRSRVCDVFKTGMGESDGEPQGTFRGDCPPFDPLAAGVCLPPFPVSFPRPPIPSSVEGHLYIYLAIDLDIASRPCASPPRERTGSRSV